MFNPKKTLMRKILFLLIAFMGLALMNSPPAIADTYDQEEICILTDDFIDFVIIDNAETVILPVYASCQGGLDLKLPFTKEIYTKINLTENVLWAVISSREMIELNNAGRQSSLQKQQILPHHTYQPEGLFRLEIGEYPLC